MPGGRSGGRGGQTTTALWHGGGTGGGTGALALVRPRTCGDGVRRGLALRLYEINTQKTVISHKLCAHF